MPRKPATAKPKSRPEKPRRETPVESARRAHAERPSAETLARYRDVLYRAGLAAADADSTEYRTLVAEAESLTPADPTWAERIECLRARSGKAGRSPRALGHLADWAMRTDFRGALPDAEQAAFDAIRQAFRAYESGDDEAAKTALAGIGIQSVFSEWKLLLRGLMAYSAGDDERAVENWRRIADDRLPATLANPLRLGIDKAHGQSLAAEELAVQSARRAVLLADPLTTKLRALRGEIGRDNKSLARAWVIVEGMLPELRRAAPHLVPRLGRCLYFAISKQGEPADLPKYKRLLGSPPADPEFHRLEAIALEDSDYLFESNAKWAKFEAWLAGSPAGWPKAVADRARAITLRRMADNAADLHESAGGPPDELRIAFEQLFSAARRSRDLGPPPADYLRRAVALAPDWPPATFDLFEELAGSDPAAAEKVATEFLKRSPNDLPMLEGLAGLYLGQKRVYDAADLRKRALATNPLDRRLRGMAAHAIQTAARQRLIDGDADAALAELDAGLEVGADILPVGFHSLRSIVLRKLKRPDEADEALRQALATSGGRLAALYTVSIDGGLVKVKPADKKAADAAFKASLAEQPTPLEVNHLYAAWDMYGAAGITYRGQKTHEKTIHDLAVRTLPADAPAFDFENLLIGLLLREHWKVAEKLAAPLDQRFPDRAALKLCLAEVLHGRGVRYMTEMRLHMLLNKATELLDKATTPDPRSEQFRERIQYLRAKYASPDDLFDFLTDRRR